tara:strand:- start:24 stop:191 length:168 start_codon:yes stop_codon:yes gene_type:complete
VYHIATPLDTNLVVELDIFSGKTAGQLLNLRSVTVAIIHCIRHHLRHGQAVEYGS